MKFDSKKELPAGITGLLLLIAAFTLLKGDAWTFLTWWLLALVIGMAFMPITGRIFERFSDRGWMFSKVLGILLSGYLVWLLVSVGVMKFSAGNCVIVTILLAVCCAGLYYWEMTTGRECLPTGNIRLVVWEELLFLAIFLMWTYLAGFHPNAYGTEKFMDYGFMEAMMRSDVLPARDLWYSEGHINYYYGGQYFAVYLTKLSGSSVEITYNLMRMFVAAFAFVLPFSLVYQMVEDMRTVCKEGRRWISSAAGILAGIAVSIAGNMHYVIYAQIIPWIQKLTGQEVTGYWFPNATRYIGHNPDRPDKTIHEFPCYSFVLGDLHAHVVNIMFVLLLIGVLYAWMSGERSKEKAEPDGRRFWLKELLHPGVLLACFLLGVYQWTNYWDFVIYFVVTGGVILFTNIIRFRGKVRQILLATLLHAIEMIGIAMLVSLPFNMKFETMVQGVALAKNHSYFYQLLVLWGLPALVTILLIVVMLWESIHSKKIRGIYPVMDSLAIPDLFALITGLCAMGLILIPELVYVRDIYENGNARANTMFKLTYQAYILFGITMAYGIFRLLVFTRQNVYKVIAGICLFCLLWTAGYFGTSVKSWFGDVWNSENYQGLYALNFLHSDFAEDEEGIYWLKRNVEGAPVVLEANGDSYSGFERVSATTGLPTILGWYVHEWLWRNDTADLNQKSADIETIFTSEDREQVEQLLSQYEVSYIFVGEKEREKYEDRLNVTMLKQLGTIVFQDGKSSTFIVQIPQSEE